ncbi:MAG: hypothetical protein JWP30_749 [Homoserinimonas sp.]|nr:hypothetical protein [Homoserinimonas sp.]
MSHHHERAARIYRESLVIDCAVPVLMQDLRDWRRYYEAGTTAILGTVTSTDDLPATVEKLSRYLELIGANPEELTLAQSSQQIVKAKADGKMAMAFHFQNGRPLGRDAGMVEVYKRLGVGVIQLCYNYRNNLGDGCLEPENAGLSTFGRDVVKKMNEHGVLVDLSHTGVRTTLEAMDCSSKPDVFTHANARAVHDHPRNLTDEQIIAVAAKGGVIGLCSFPAFITDKTLRPSVNDVLAHLDHIVEVAGIDHVGIGTDYFHDSGYRLNVDLGNWSADEYPAPPWHYPLDGTNTVELAVGLSERGYSDEDIAKVLGENFMRVFAEVWG